MLNDEAESVFRRLRESLHARVSAALGPMLEAAGNPPQLLICNDRDTYVAKTVDGHPTLAYVVPEDAYRIAVPRLSPDPNDTTTVVGGRSYQ